MQRMVYTWRLRKDALWKSGVLEYSKGDIGDEWEQDAFENIEKCVEDAKKNYAVTEGEIIEIAVLEPFKINVDAKKILDAIEQDARTYFGEKASNWKTYDCEKGKEALGALSAYLSEGISDWLKTQNNTPNFYHIRGEMLMKVR